jgi:TP901 family phage tail tape measure protein
MSRVRGGQVFVEIGADPRRLFKSLQDLNKHIGKLGSQLTGLGTRMSAFGAALAAPLALATRQFATFDDAIRATAAVSGASGTALQSLNDKARELGATTSFTAVQVANLMTELGRAGFRPDEIEAMTGAVLDLARATGTDATLAAGIMAATLRQFGLGATEGARAADVLTKAANATFNTVEGLGESLKYAGPVAQSLGMSLEDTVAVLGVLGNVGIQGSEAGTALRRLSVIAAGSGEELQKIFGVTNQDAAGNLKPLVDVLDEINTVTAGMPVAERTAKMAQAFGLLGITSANVLSSSADGVKGLAEQLKNAQGTAAATAKEMDAGLGGAMRITLSAIEGTALAIGDALAPSIQHLVEGIGHAASTLTTFVKNNQEMVVGVAKGIATFAGISAAILGMGVALSAVAAAFGLVLSPIGLIVAGVVGLVAAVNQATGVLGQLAGIASTTFAGIYDALAAGDLGLAMEIMWAGVQAALIRGVNATMATLDSWVAFLQNTFTYAGADLYAVWESLWSGIAQLLNTNKAIVLGVVDNIVNGVMASFDAMVAAVRKSWNWVQSFFVRGYDLAKENDKVDSEMAARAQQRSASRPGIVGRVAQAQQENSRTAAATQSRIDGARANADAIAAGRLDENARRAAARDADAVALEGRVGELRETAADRRAVAGQVGDLDRSLGSVTGMDELQALASTFRELRDSGKLSAEQLERLEGSLDAASERVMEAGLSGSNDTRQAAAAGAAAAQATATTSAAEVVGTFSGAALGQLGFGSNLAQKQLDTMKQIEQNTRDPMAGLVAD